MELDLHAMNSDLSNLVAAKFYISLEAFVNDCLDNEVRPSLYSTRVDRKVEMKIPLNTSGWLLAVDTELDSGPGVSERQFRRNR